MAHLFPGITISFFVRSQEENTESAQGRKRRFFSIGGSDGQGILWYSKTKSEWKGEIQNDQWKIFELIFETGWPRKNSLKKTGISQSTISDWKRKGTNPSADKILKICEVLKVTPYELLGENEIERKAVDLEMCAANTEEKMILEGFRNLPDRKKERILGYLAALQEE